MPSKKRRTGFDRLLALTTLGTRFGFAGGFALLCADLIAGFAPPEMQSVTYAMSGATCALLYWFLIGRILRAADRHIGR